MSDVPQLELVSIAPLSILLPLPLISSLILIRFSLIRDESIEVRTGLKEGDDLTCLVLNNNCLRRAVLFLVDGK